MSEENERQLQQIPDPRGKERCSEVSSSEPPLTWEQPVAGHSRIQSSDPINHSTSGPSSTKLEVKESILPLGWEQKLDKNGRPYYVDHNTKSTTFSKPGTTILPSGWERRLTKNGRSYYVDHNTKSTSWSRPDNLSGNNTGQETLSELPGLCSTSAQDKGQYDHTNGEPCLDEDTIAIARTIQNSTNKSLAHLQDRMRNSTSSSSSVISNSSELNKSSDEVLWESFGALCDEESKFLQRVLPSKEFEKLLQSQQTKLGLSSHSKQEKPNRISLSDIRDGLSALPSHQVRLALFDRSRSRYMNRIHKDESVTNAAIKPIIQILSFAAWRVFDSASTASKDIPICEPGFIQRVHHEMRTYAVDEIPKILYSLTARIFDNTNAHSKTGHISAADIRRYLDIVIEMAEKTRMLLPERSEQWASISYHAAVMHRMKYSRFTSEADLHLSLKLGAVALEVLPKTHSLYSACLDHMVFIYSQIHENGGGDTIYLTEALRLARLEVAMKPVELNVRASRMSRLADLLIKTFLCQHDGHALDEAADLLNQARGLEPRSPQVCADISFNLGRVQMIRFSILKDKADLRKGLENHQRATQIIPQGHPSLGRFYQALASAVKARYEEFLSWEDLVLASSLFQEAASMVDGDDKSLVHTYIEGGLCLKTAFEVTREECYWENSIKMFEAARFLTSAPLMARICSSIFAGYLFAEKRRWAEAFRAFQSGVHFLEELATDTITHDDQQVILKKFGDVSATAAAVSLEAGVEPWMALQTLERGRGVILDISMSRRSEISELQMKNPGLYEKYTQLRSTLYSKPLEHDILQSFEDRPTKMVLEIRDHQRQIQQLEEQIQDELGPKAFHRLATPQDFQQLAIPGPIVAFNTTKIRSDAFIITNKEVKSIHLQGLNPERLEESTAFLVGTKAASKSSMSKEKQNEKLDSFLEWLWVHAVLPALQELNLISPNPPTELPRIWWVANGMLGLAPLHAAGVPAKLKQSASTYVVSSFVPTLRALSRARERSMDLQCFDQRALVVTMSKTKGLGDLNVFEDERVIKSSLPSTVEPESLKLPSKTRVLKSLESSSAVFFSCHGVIDFENPANSGLLLGEDPESEPERLTFRDLSHCSTKLGKLACLLACSTAATSHQELADEVLHVVSGFHLAGFPHVIGSLWPVGDRTTTEVLEAFMKDLTNSHHDDAAIARSFHRAVETKRVIGKGRKLSKNPIAWAPYVHFGC